MQGGSRGQKSKGSHWVKTKVRAGSVLLKALSTIGNTVPPCPPPACFQDPGDGTGHPDNQDSVPHLRICHQSHLQRPLGRHPLGAWGSGEGHLWGCPAPSPDARRMSCSSRQRWQCRAAQTGRPSNNGADHWGLTREEETKPTSHQPMKTSIRWKGRQNHER